MKVCMQIDSIVKWEKIYHRSIRRITYQWKD